MNGEAVIVDSTVWIDYLAGRDTAQTLWLDDNFDVCDIGVTDLILCEVLQGTRTESEFQQAKEDLLRFDVYHTGGREISIAAARNYRSLRVKGITVRKTIGCLIATFCIHQGCLLLHNDRDFDPFEKHLGLRVVRTDRIT